MTLLSLFTQRAPAAPWMSFSSAYLASPCFRCGAFQAEVLPRKVSGVVGVLEGRDAIQRSPYRTEVGWGKPQKVQQGQAQAPARGPLSQGWAVHGLRVALQRRT